MRFSTEWWTVFGVVTAVLGAIIVMFCWWMDRRIARFAAEDAGPWRDDYACAEGIVADGADGLEAEIDRILRGDDLDQSRSVS